MNSNQMSIGCVTVQLTAENTENFASTVNSYPVVYWFDGHLKNLMGNSNEM